MRCSIRLLEVLEGMRIAVVQSMVQSIKLELWRRWIWKVEILLRLPSLSVPGRKIAHLDQSF